MNQALIVRAEWKSLTTATKDWKKVKLVYDLAINTSMKHKAPNKQYGRVHEAGITCEKCGEYLLSVDQQQLAVAYLEQAFKMYQEWGAIIKVEQLQDKFSDYITGHRSRQHTRSTDHEQTSTPVIEMDLHNKNNDMVYTLIDGSFGMNTSVGIKNVVLDDDVINDNNGMSNDDDDMSEVSVLTDRS